jgi:rifampicin phosphotransferase
MLPELIMNKTILAELSYPPQEEDPFALQQDLKGMAASAGIVEGICVTMSDLEGLQEFEDEAILLSETAGPELAPIIPKVKGLITERGGLLAMGSRSAREYEIPAVVGIKNLMSRIHIGDRIRVNGTEGLVEVIFEGL